VIQVLRWNWRGLTLSGVLVKIAISVGIHWLFMEVNGAGDEFRKFLRELPGVVYDALWIAVDEVTQ